MELVITLPEEVQLALVQRAHERGYEDVMIEILSICRELLCITQNDWTYTDQVARPRITASPLWGR